ncbi:delta-1-pyrroline-5-carboxylate dehydrogenase, mitochondrial [Drosophila subpulchrella]|uniref:delta-1-pyrroline-5-carboxylate dehydrogenase, mitochondrial n=1 Tax=Drosophila subpulchrella TaxID=1486046 RepID=UPI0018A167D7|nr:delta-1-pyrroline-5-carboxylate dehydrogenase, mitochondrial [Drosophila subpulchrella]
MLKLGVAVPTRWSLRWRHLAMAGIRGEAKLSVGMEKTNRQQEQEEKQPEVEATEDSPRRQRNESVLINHAIHEIKHRPLEVPTIIGDDPVYTMDKQQVSCPHHLKTNLAHVFYANRKQIETAIRSALSTQGTWSLVPIAERLAIWRRAADIIEEDELRLRVFLMLTLSKTSDDATRDIRRLLSSLRANADYLEHLSELRFEIQGDMNVFPSFHLRPMDGFVAALAPFESVALSTSLALCPALMGNTVLWNPSLEVAPASFLIHRAFQEAGLPSGVVNFVPANERLFLDTITDAVHFAGLNSQGSAAGYRHVHKLVSDRMERYICFPRLVAECPGQNFHFVHASAKVESVVTATIQAAFGFAGQYANSLSRMYVPSSIWPRLQEELLEATKQLNVGDPVQPETDMGAMVNIEGFQRMQSLVERTKSMEVLCGSSCDDSIGRFVQPTIIRVVDPLDPLLCEPCSGPFLPVFVYADDSFGEALKLAANQSRYALSGSIFASRDEVILHCLNQLRMSASNLYVNERCTGSHYGLTPFGGNRLSGTNDKSGSAYFLMRWSSPLLIEETVEGPVPSQGSKKFP